MQVNYSIELSDYNLAKYQKAFTLIELLIVVVCVAILSAIAIPNYRDYVQRAKINEATSNLSDWRNRMERFYQDNRTYINVGGNCGVANPTPVKVVSFNYVCAGTAQTYTLTANGLAAQGMAGFSFTIDHNNIKTSTVNFGGTSSSSNTCWLRKTGSC